MTRRLVLASSSPTRYKVLESAGFAPAVVVSGVDELVPSGLATDEAVALLARRKLAAVIESCGDALVVACDSMLDLAGVALGKPRSTDEARSVWTALAGRSATLFTGHCLADTSTGRQVEAVASTTVCFGSPSDEEIEALLTTTEPTSVAGGFTIDGYSAPFVDSVLGSPSNVLGLCLPTFRKLLGESGVSLTSLWRDV